MTTPTPTTVQVKIQLRRDTAATWASVNPVLLAGEAGLETDTNKIKIGNGSTAWNSLGYFPFVVNGGTVTGNLEIGTTGTLTFEGSSADNFETTLGVINPTADRTINLPNVSGTIITTGDTGTVTSTMIADGTIVDADIAANAEIAVSKLADGAARQLLQTDAAGTGVEWTSNVDIPGTLDVTGTATFDGAVTVAGDLTVNGTTTTISTQNLLVEDKNIIIGDVATPTDVTADGGGITLKGATDKTINWVDSTDAWTSSERFSVPLGSAASPSLTFTGNANSGLYSPGSGQVAISTGGSGRLFVDASGRLSLGTAAATAQLFLEHPTVSDFRQSVNTVLQTNIYASSSDVNIFSVQANPLRFGTNNTERLRITSAGNVGIGTTSPLAGNLLDVRGAVLSTQHFRSYVGSLDANSTRGFRQSIDGNELFALYHNNNAAVFEVNSAERARIDSSGRLGVGTSSPSGRLDVQGGDVYLGKTAQGDIFFSDGNDTYVKGASNIFLQTPNGSNRITVKGNTGNVGIGTTSPSYLLDVAGTARIGATTGDAALEIGTGASANRNAYIDLVGDTTYTDYGTRIIRLGGGANADSRIQHRGTGALALETADAGASIVFLQQPGERARIDSSGRLLVGTSSAYAVASGFSGVTQQIVGNDAASFLRYSADNSSETLWFCKSRNATLGQHTVLQSGDGIARFNFQGSDGTNFITAARIDAEVDGTPGANDMPGRLVFSTTADGASSPTERMRINSQGQVGIGTASGNPVADNVTGIWFNGTTGVGYVGASGEAAFYANRKTSDGAVVDLRRNGLTVGNISVTTSATAYNTSSDYRLKENVTLLTGAADRLKQLPVHRFNFIADPTKTVDGFLAHEAAEVVPECVTGEKDAVDDNGNPVYQGIDQSKLVPLLTAALQEAVAKIESLEARLTAAGI